jgi:hypothetical protein
MKFRITVIACGTALLIAAAVGVVVASRNHRQPAPPPDVPVAASPAEVRVKAVERKPEPSDHEVIEASAAVAIVCGEDAPTADRYEARNDALRSIAWRRDLPAYTEGSDPFAHVQIYGPPGKNPPAGRYLW